MPVVDLGNGAFAIVCGSRRRRSCSWCGRGSVTKLCDFPVARGRTCDAGMCDACATNIAHEVDYCPKHKHERPAALQAELNLGGSDAS